MTTYRAYRVDARRHIQSGQWLNADNDAEARDAAAELCDPQTPHIELWQAARLVDEIDCADE